MKLSWGNREEYDGGGVAERSVWDWSRPTGAISIFSSVSSEEEMMIISSAAAATEGSFCIVCSGNRRISKSQWKMLWIWALSGNIHFVYYLKEKEKEKKTILQKLFYIPHP